MRRITIIHAAIFLFAFCNTSFGQTDKDTAHQKGKEAVQLEDQGRFDDALKLLDTAHRLDPNNITYPYEMTYCYYSQKQYQKVIDVLEKLKGNPRVFDRLYELLGNAYDVSGQTDKAIATYREGLQKFPNSGALYLEMGVIPLYKKDYDTAMQYFEKGIEMQADFPSNYYWAAKLYCYSDNAVWGMLYGELFMNLERNSRRTQEISKLLYDTYKRCIVFKFAGKIAVSFDKQTLVNGIGGNPVKLPYNLVYEPVMGLAAVGYTNISLNSLDRIRQNFLKFYMNKFAAAYPNALFSYQEQIRQSGNFEAYNYWLLSQGDIGVFNAWKNTHQTEWDDFVKWFIQHPIQLSKNNRLYAGQYN